MNKILIRPMTFKAPENPPRIWATTLFHTSLLNALSASLPAAETFFLSVINRFRLKVTEPHLKEAMAGFIGQEKWHQSAHQSLNTFVESTGISSKKLYDLVREDMDRAHQLPELDQLALVGASEHFTLILARYALSNDHLLNLVDPRFRRLWVQHCLEEIEHKSVAFDAMSHFQVSYWRRIRVMAIASINVPRQIFGGMFLLLNDQGGLKDIRVLRDIVSFFFSLKTGFFWYSLIHQTEFFFPWYHPNNRDDSHLIEKFRAYLEASAQGEEIAKVS